MLCTTLWSTILASSACFTIASATGLHVDRSRRLVGVDALCGTAIDPSTIAAFRGNARNQPSTSSILARRADNSSVPLPIDVYMQILSADGTEEGGNISDETIGKQFTVLNEAFLHVGFQFRVVDIIRTINERWYHNLTPGSSIEEEVTVLRKGGNATLNVYTMGALNTSTQAWGSVPSELQYHSQYDGVTINGTAFLGGSDPVYGLGRSMIHEVGHWFGLYHTFAYGCEKSYDYVDDTPIENQPIALGGCDVGRDSCPDQPGLDLVHNYMSYSSDECRDSFTPGQVQRMREQMAKWRGIVYPGIVVGDIPDDV
ncbi:metalloprotease [Pleomassaria siparia CBS 279.74]|uniref:Metalloprotease n=1 Tax=Pleomassaria siparia CBS 279.74 TaxID=1314801 RepID=A0A6G1K7S5_9PLEO|nr:metalloprotease [Pleomassaria siparia CBS 279.74]